MRGRRYVVFSYILKYVILSQILIPGVLSCILLLNGWTPLSVYERTILADIVISGFVIDTYKDTRTTAETYTAKVKLLEVYKGIEHMQKVSVVPGTYNVYNISNFGDKKMCYADVMDGENYIFFVTVYKGRLSAQYDDIFGAAVEFTKTHEEEVIKQLGWDVWSPWEPCSRTCNGGTQTRQRECMKKNVTCDGASIDKRQCNIFSCSGTKDLLDSFGVYKTPRGVHQNTNRTSAYNITKRANLFSPLSSTFQYGFPVDFSVLVTSNIPTGSDGYLLTLSDIMGKQRLAVQYGQSSSKLEYIDQNNLPGSKAPSFDVKVADDNWHQFAYSVKGHVIKLYLDCMEVTSKEFQRSEFSFLGLNLMFSVGPYFARYGSAFEGQLEQLTISSDPEAASLQCSRQNHVGEQAINDGGEPHAATTTIQIVTPSTETKHTHSVKEHPVDWSSWSSCSTTCGQGTQSRTLYCMNNIVDINECIPKNTEKEERRNCFLKDCKAPCELQCLNGGKCDASGRCICKTGYEGNQCQTPVCNPGCKNGGQCIAPNKCSCLKGFKGRLCKKGNKKALCKPKCKNGGRCVKGGMCSCLYGFIPPSCEPFCSQTCHNGGRCIGFNTCKCRRGYTGKDCTKPTCKRGCQNGGKCVSPNRCSCPRGYRGKTCKKSICFPECQNRGKCIFPFVCKCRHGYHGIYCQEYKCRRKCKNGGKCIGPNKCACPFGFSGKWCQRGHCSLCLNGGRCKKNKCKCPAGFSGKRCEKRKCFYEQYFYPYQRTYKKLLREEYTTKCGPWRWKTCVQTRLKYLTVTKIMYRTAYRCI